MDINNHTSSTLEIASCPVYEATYKTRIDYSELEELVSKHIDSKDPTRIYHFIETAIKDQIYYMSQEQELKEEVPDVCPWCHGRDEVLNSNGVWIPCNHDGGIDLE